MADRCLYPLDRRILMRRAFTIIEVLVVLVLLGVLSGIAVARLGSGKNRAMAGEMQRLGMLFDAASRRASARAEPVLVRFTPLSAAAARAEGAGALPATGRGTFAVMSRRTTQGRYTLEQSDWKPDNLIAPVSLSLLRIESVRVNDSAVSFASGLSVLLNDPSSFGQRTTIRLVPADGPRNAGAYEIRLSSDAQRVKLIHDPKALGADELTPDGLLRLPTMDLDAIGFGGMAW